jgi:DNA processing protein
MDLLRLRLAPEMNRNRFRALVQHLGGFSAVTAAGPAAVQQILRNHEFDPIALCRGPKEDCVQAELDGLAALGARAICIADDDYPSALRQSNAPAPLLFVQGTLHAQDEAAVAIIGSRKATAYGMAAAAAISGALARAGITVVSGFARGVDTAAHRAALEAGGRTLAILGNGLDICYPSENRGMQGAVIRQGAFITEYPLGTKSLPDHFPERNLLIACLGLGTAVMEAAERSGTLITCRFALEENRLLFALPGDVTRHNSRGTNRLIRDGAILIQDASDILRELAPRLRGILNGWLIEDHVTEEDQQDNRIARSTTRPRPARTAPQAITEPELPRVLQAELPGLGLATEPMPASPEPSAPQQLDPQVRTILELILHEPLQFDELAARAAQAGIPPSKVAAHLLKLELRGLIRQMPGRIYAAL